MFLGFLRLYFLRLLIFLSDRDKALLWICHSPHMPIDHFSIHLFFLPKHSLLLENWHNKFFRNPEDRCVFNQNSCNAGFPRRWIHKIYKEENAGDVKEGVRSVSLDGLCNRCLFFQWICYPLFSPSPISGFYLWSDKGYQHPPSGSLELVVASHCPLTSAMMPNCLLKGCSGFSPWAVILRRDVNSQQIVW